MARLGRSTKKSPTAFTAGPPTVWLEGLRGLILAETAFLNDIVARWFQHKEKAPPFARGGLCTGRCEACRLDRGAYDEDGSVRHSFQPAAFSRQSPPLARNRR
jgi:hypothetical protein